MQGWAGFATLLVGLGVTAFAFHPGLGSGGADLSDVISRPAPAETALADGAPAAVPHNRLFSPQSPLFAPAPPVIAKARPERSPQETGAAASAAQPSLTVAAMQPVSQAPMQPWSTAVTANGEKARVRSSRPEGAEARADLVREL